MIIQAINGGINAGSCGLQLGVLQALGQAVFQVAELNDQALNEVSQAALVGGDFGGGSGCGSHGCKPQSVGVTASDNTTQNVAATGKIATMERVYRPQKKLQVVLHISMEGMLVAVRSYLESMS
jgi:hypothetical protein